MDRPYNVLVLCNTNSARSLMAEALIETLGHGRFRAFSAARQPAGHVHPLALAQIASTGYPLDRLRSKSWDEFNGPSAPHMDLVLTVCDDTVGELLPEWPGHPATAHWHFHDPAAVHGDEATQRDAFARVFREIMGRVLLFVNLPPAMLDKAALASHASDSKP